MPDDSLDAALAKATAERDRLAKILADLEAERERAVAELTMQRDRLAKRKAALEKEHGAALQRLTDLENGLRIALKLSDRLRKGVHVMLRLVLGTIAVFGMMMFFSSRWVGPWTVLGAFALEIATVWFLADAADRRELTRE